MLYNDAVILFKAKQYSKSKKAFKMLLKSGEYSKKKFIIYNYLSQIAIIEGEFSKALSYAEKILESDNKKYYGHQLLGRIYYKFGKYEEALDYLYKGSKLDLKDESAIHYDLAKLYIFLKKTDKAILELITHISENKMPNPRSYFELAKLYFDAQDYDNTLKYIAFGNAKGYNDKDGYYMAGKIYFLRKDLKKAKAYMRMYLDDNHVGNALIEKEIKDILSIDKEPSLS